MKPKILQVLEDPVCAIRTFVLSCGHRVDFNVRWVETDNDFVKLSEKVATTVNQHNCWVTEMARVTGASNRWTPHGDVQMIYLDCGCELEVPVRSMVLAADIRDWQDQVRRVAMAHEHLPGVAKATIRVEPYSPNLPAPPVQVTVITPRAPVGFQTVRAQAAPVALPVITTTKAPEIKKDRFELLDLD